MGKKAKIKQKQWGIARGKIGIWQMGELEAWVSQCNVGERLTSK